MVGLCWTVGLAGLYFFFLGWLFIYCSASLLDSLGPLLVGLRCFLWALLGPFSGPLLDFFFGFLWACNWSSTWAFFFPIWAVFLGFSLGLFWAYFLGRFARFSGLLWTFSGPFIWAIFAVISGLLWTFLGLSFGPSSLGILGSIFGRHVLGHSCWISLDQPLSYFDVNFQVCDSAGIIFGLLVHLIFPLTSNSFWLGIHFCWAFI